MTGEKEERDRSGPSGHMGSRVLRPLAFSDESLPLVFKTDKHLGEQMPMCGSESSLIDKRIH